MLHDIQPTVCNDGSNTLIHSVLKQPYHSLRGAVAEACHVYLEAGFNVLNQSEVRLFDLGFGTGLNAALTAFEATRLGRKVDYYSVEKYPLSPQIAAQMNYFSDSPAQRNLYETLHAAPWDTSTAINEHFTLTKITGSVLDIALPEALDLIYYDAFAPDVQPELWSYDIFTKFAAATRREGLLVTYSSKGTVKQNLRQSGWEVHRLPGACGKHHMLRAVKL